MEHKMSAIERAYVEFTPGSRDFCHYVNSHCGYCASTAEIQRIGEKAQNAAEFDHIWEDEAWWADENFPGSDGLGEF